MAFDLAGQALQCHRRLQVSNHGVHFGGLQDGLELGVAAGPTDLVELYPRGDHLEARRAPGTIDRIGRTVRRDQGAITAKVTNQ